MSITAKIAEQDATQELPALTRCQPVSFGVILRTLMEKNISQNAYTRLQKYYGSWLKVFLICCLANSIGLYFFGTNDRYLKWSMLVPFIHLGVIWCALIIYSIYSWARLYDNENAMYIKENYPSIWKKLHPFGDFSVNGFARILFLMGKYDDGKDERLNQIKFSQKVKTKLILYTFFMVPAIWIFNIIAVMIPKIIEKV